MNSNSITNYSLALTPEKVGEKANKQNTENLSSDTTLKIIDAFKTLDISNTTFSELKDTYLESFSKEMLGKLAAITRQRQFETLIPEAIRSSQEYRYAKASCFPNRTANDIVNNSEPEQWNDLKNDVLKKIADSVTELKIAEEVSNDRLKELVDLFPNLESLTIELGGETGLWEILARCPKLLRLNLSYYVHHINGPELLCLPPSIKELKFPQSSTSKEAFQYFTHFKNLETLEFGIDDITALDLDQLPEGLKELHIYSKDPEIFSHLSRFENLEVLGIEVHRYAVNDTHMNCLPPGIKGLLLYGNLSKDIFKALGRFKNLKEVSFSDMEVSGRDLDGFPRALEKIDLFQAKFSPDAFKALASFENLKDLDIFGLRNKKITRADLECLPLYITKLNIGKNNLTDEEATCLARFKHLKEINLCGNEKITDKTLQNLPSTTEILDLSTCALSDDSIKSLAHLRNLQVVRLMENMKLTGSNFSYIPGGATIPYTKYLYLSEAAKKYVKEQNTHTY